MGISNKIKEKLNSNKPALVVSGYFDSPNIVEYISSLNVDGIWLEGEHGPIDFSNVPNLSRACDLYGVSSIFRITSHEYGLIYRYLDLGAQGLVIPHVSNKEQALHIVKSAKYFPIGERGMFTSRRGLNIPKEEYMDFANNNSLIIIIIEDVEGLNNLDEILTVDNIDVFFIAPNDLAQSMGIPNKNPNDELDITISNSIKKIKKAGKKAGTLSNPEKMDHHLKLGVDLLLIDTSQFIKSGISSLLDKIN